MFVLCKHFIASEQVVVFGVSSVSADRIERIQNRLLNKIIYRFEGWRLRFSQINNLVHEDTRQRGWYFIILNKFEVF